MEKQKKQQRKLALVLRWIARAWSIGSIGLLLGFVVGEGIHPTKQSEWLGLLFFPLGITIGMIVGWWRDGIGGIITLGSLFVFYGIHILTAGGFPQGWAWLMFAAPGFLFLLSWYVLRKSGVVTV
jgi:hypothetical protein